MKSIIDGDVYDICFLCGKRACHTHHIFGKYNRKRSDKYGLTVRLCFDCHQRLHDKNENMQYLHEIGQQAFEEKIGSRERFRQEFNGSYL